MRNATVRIMILMPLVLIILRLMNQRHFGEAGVAGNQFASDFFKYGEGLMATVGVLYVFLILAGLFCNEFAFERAGMRALILSPQDRKTHSHRQKYLHLSFGIHLFGRAVGCERNRLSRSYGRRFSVRRV